MILKSSLIQRKNNITAICQKAFLSPTYAHKQTKQNSGLVGWWNDGMQSVESSIAVNGGSEGSRGSAPVARGADRAGFGLVPERQAPKTASTRGARATPRRCVQLVASERRDTADACQPPYNTRTIMHKHPLHSLPPENRRLIN